MRRPSAAERDLLARIPLLLIWMNQLVQMAQAAHVVGLLTAFSTAIGLAFLLRRRLAVDVDYGVAAWLAGIAGTVIPMLLEPGGSAVAPDAVTMPLAVVGVLITTAGVWALGTSIGVVPSNRGIVSRGIYRSIRHPLYAGYVITHVAFCLANPTPRNMLVFAIGDGLQLVRIHFEERLLARDAAYRSYRLRVPWRLVPGVF